jgi:cobalt-zinc-cadmium efflux system membrane fusion protein
MKIIGTKSLVGATRRVARVMTQWRTSRRLVPTLLLAALCVGCSKATKDEHAGCSDHGCKDNKPKPGMCGEHGVLEEKCGICNPDKIAKLKPGEGLEVRLPSKESTKIVGVETATPTVGTAAESIECTAELAFNQNKLAQLVAPVSGIIQSVEVDLGTQVKERQPVARIWSASISETVAKAVLSHQTLERERKLREGGIAPAKDLQEAEAAHRAACQQARTLGFSEGDIDAMRSCSDEPVYLEIRALFDGEIIERNAVRGAQIEAGKPLFTEVDRSTMWAMLNIPEAQLSRVQIGQTVELMVDALPGKTFTGKLTWIAAQVNDRTRLALARAEVPNPDGLLRDKMFARARILTRQADKALLVPANAIQKVEGHPLVFVKQAEDLFEARAVRLGARHNGALEVLDGLKPDEIVVVARSFALKSQLLMSRLGAGCGDD